MFCSKKGISLRYLLFGSKLNIRFSINSFQGKVCFKLPFCLLGNIRDTFVFYEKAKFDCFNYMQLQKVKFTYIQIYMKKVLYSPNIFGWGMIKGAEILNNK